MTMLLLWIFGSISFAMVVAFCTWGAAQAGAGREFARLGPDGGLDVIDAFHEEIVDRCDRMLAGTS
jgi:hypothetical protein